MYRNCDNKLFLNRFKTCHTSTLTSFIIYILGSYLQNIIFVKQTRNTEYQEHIQTTFHCKNSSILTTEYIKQIKIMPKLFHFIQICSFFSLRQVLKPFHLSN